MSPSLAAKGLKKKIRRKKRRIGLESVEKIDAAAELIWTIHNPRPFDDAHGIAFCKRNAHGSGRQWRELGTIRADEVFWSFDAIVEAGNLGRGGYFCGNGTLPPSREVCGLNGGKYREPSLHWLDNLAAAGLRKPKRKVEALTTLGTIVIDVDTYAHGLSNYIAEALINERLDGLGIPVSIWMYADGLRAVLSIVDDDGFPLEATAKNLLLWKKVASALCTDLERFGQSRGYPTLGIDEGATMNPVGTIRVPESRSTKNWKRVTHAQRFDGGEVIRHNFWTMCERLGVSMCIEEEEALEPRALAFPPRVTTSKVPAEVREANRLGPIVRALRVWFQVQALFRSRVPECIPEGFRYHACMEFAGSAHAARWAAKWAVANGAQGAPQVAEWFGVHDLLCLAGKSDESIQCLLLQFASRNCGPSYVRRREGTRSVLTTKEVDAAHSAVRNLDGSKLARRSAAITAKRFRVAPSEAEALARDWGGNPWPVDGVKKPRARAAHERRELIRRILARPAVADPSPRELRGMIEAETGRLWSKDTLAADLKAMGLR